jgi:hypothetical protein
MRNTIAAMRVITTPVAILSLLLAVLYAPLFHLHEDHDHVGGAPFIHAHLPEMAFHASSHSEEGAEPAEDHVDAPSVDFLTTNIPTLVQIPLFIIEEVLQLRADPTFSGFAVSGNPHAHDPPALIRSNPRSPPV